MSFEKRVRRRPTRRLAVSQKLSFSRDCIARIFEVALCLFPSTVGQDYKGMDNHNFGHALDHAGAKQTLMI